MGVSTKTDKGAYGRYCIALLLAKIERQSVQALSSSERLLPDEDEFGDTLDRASLANITQSILNSNSKSVLPECDLPQDLYGM